MKKLFLAFISLALIIVLTGCAQLITPIQKTTPFALVSGTPPYVDPDPIVYEGRVELKGWIEIVPAYVEGTETEHFRISDESLSQMPSDLLKKDNVYYLLESIDDKTMAELKLYNKDNPATIIVEGLTVVQEGSPRLEFEKKVN